MNAPLPRAATQADFAALLVALAIDHARAYGRPGARRQTTHAPVDGLAARPCTAEEYAVQQPSGMAVAGVPVSSLQPAGACDVALAGDGREAVNELLVVSASEPSTDILGAVGERGASTHGTLMKDRAHGQAQHAAQAAEQS